MNHITQEQSGALFSKVDRDISIKPWNIRLHRFANAAIEWHISQVALQHEPENEPAVSLASQAAPKEPVNQKLVEALEQIASFDKYEPAGPAAYTAQAALDMYKKDQKTNTSQERVKKSEKSEQVPLADDQIEAAVINVFAGKKLAFCPTIEDAMRFARAIEAAHGIGGKK